MSNTFRHKSKGKYNNGLIDYKDVLQSVKDEWDRSNNDIGEFRAKKKNLIESIIEKEVKNQIINNDIEYLYSPYDEWYN